MAAEAFGVAMNFHWNPAPMLAALFAIAATGFGVQLGAPVLALRTLDLCPATRGAVSSLFAFLL